MAGNKISALGSNSTIAAGDLFPNVDVSDTSQGAAGTTKKSTAAQLATYMLNNPASGTTRAAAFQVVDGATALATGDGKAYIPIPSTLNGYNITSGAIQVIIKSTSGTPTVQVARGRQANATSDFTYSDVFSTKITIDANEYDSKDATTPMVVDTANDDLATGDVLRVDCDLAGTGAKGLTIRFIFTLP